MPKTSTLARPSANLPMMKRHIELMFGDASWTYQGFSKQGSASRRPGYVAAASSITSVLQHLAAENANSFDIGVVPNQLSSKGRKAEHCQHIRMLFVDLDAGGHKLKTVLKAFPVKPHLVIRSSTGRYHAYWRIKGVAVADFRPLMLALAAKYSGDANVADPSRCMRLAGTWNHKRGERASLVHPKVGVESLPAPIEKAFFCEQMDVSAEHLTKATTASAADMETVDDDQSVSKLGIDDVRRLLAYIDPTPRDAWLEMGMALHSRWPTKEGYTLWTIWSATSSKFDEEDQHKTWGGFKVNGRVTLGTLVHLARQSAPALPAADEASYATALVRDCCGRVGFDIKNETWWHFNGHHWERLGNQTQALQFVYDQVAHWKTLHGADAVRELDKTALMAVALRRAALAKEMHVDASVFDNKPDLLGVPNGVVNLRTGEFRAGQPDDGVTRKTSVVYDPDAKCPAFMAFMKRLCKGNKGLFLFVMAVLGYCLTSETKEQKMFVVIGDGGNGKGVMMNAVQDVFGDYAVTLSMQELMGMSKGNANAAAPALARLKGRRLMLASEVFKDRPLDEPFVKRLTGHDKFTWRGIYSGHYEEARMVGKPFLLCNHVPQIAYGDKSMWRRIIVLPVDAQLTDSAADKGLPEALAAESAGILRLLVKHAGKYLAEGLPECALVEEATLALRNSTDTVRSWIDDCCREDTKASYPAEDAQKAYRAHTLALGTKSLGPQAFSAAMARLGFASTRRGSGVRYQGVRPLNAE